MGNGPVIIKYSEILKIIKSLPMNEFNESKHIIYVRSDNEEKDKTDFLKTLLRIIHTTARSSAVANSKKLLKEFEKIFDSVADSLWERIKYENVNFFVNDVKSNVYETALNMFMKEYFGASAPFIKNGVQYNIDGIFGTRTDINGILVTLVDTDGTTKVCNLNKLFENVYTPNTTYDAFITFANDCLPSVSYPDYFFHIIYRFYKYFEINRMITDHFLFINLKKSKYHEAFENILMRNDIFMKSFGIEYAKFSKQFMSSICDINANYPNLEESITKEVLPILTNKESHVGDFAECNFARDVLNILTKAKSMSAPNLDSRCNTLCEDLDYLEKSYIDSFKKLFELKEKIFEPLEYNETSIAVLSANLFFNNDVCPLEYQSYKKIFEECVSEVSDAYRRILSILETWCVKKIDDKVNYGYNYEARRDFGEYFTNRKYVNTDDFVKFTNPAIYNLIKG